MTQRIIALLLTLLLLSGALIGCNRPKNDGKLDIVCTVFPLYDWVGSIIGEHTENVTLTLLVQNGTDVHSYEPTVADIATVTDCDLLIHVGGESEAWLEKVLTEKLRASKTVLTLLPLLGERAVEEQLPEGAEQDEHADHGHVHQSENAYDEHVWLSLQNAACLLPAITETLCAAAPQHSQAWQQNAQAYLTQIRALDASFADTVASAACRTLLFADRFPFRYLAEDYGLTCYAAFSGCSAETEASFETVAFLSAKVDELRLGSVLILERGNRALAQTVIANTSAKNAAVLELDSLQSYTAGSDAPDYLTAMRANLAVLRQALNP